MIKALMKVISENRNTGCYTVMLHGISKPFLLVSFMILSFPVSSPHLFYYACRLQLLLMDAFLRLK
jgi:hypothetical protein